MADSISTTNNMTDSEINDRINQLNNEINLLKSKLNNKKVDNTIDSSSQNNKTSSLPSSFYRISALSSSQISRYSRHLILPYLTITAQEKICNSKVLVIGCGGLGSTLILYLSSCGIGKLGLVDWDVVEVSNLHRQIIHNVLIYS